MIGCACVEPQAGFDVVQTDAGAAAVLFCRGLAAVCDLMPQIFQRGLVHANAVIRDRQHQIIPPVVRSHPDTQNVFQPFHAIEDAVLHHWLKDQLEHFHACGIAAVEPDLIIDFASVADALDVHVHLNVLQLLPERHEQPARNAQPV